MYRASGADPRPLFVQVASLKRSTIRFLCFLSVVTQQSKAEKGKKQGKSPKGSSNKTVFF